MNMKQLILVMGVLLALLSLLCLSLVGLVSADNLYEYVDTSANNDNDIYGNTWRGQSFTIGTVGTSEHLSVTNVSVKIGRAGSPTNLIVRLYKIKAGYPTGSALASVTLADCSSLTTASAGAWVSFDFTSQELVLYASGRYCLVLSCSGDSSNYVEWNYYTSDGYLYDNQVYSNNAGSSWSVSANYDYAFKLYGWSYEFPECPTEYDLTVHTNLGHVSGDYDYTDNGDLTGDLWLNYTECSIYYVCVANENMYSYNVSYIWNNDLGYWRQQITYYMYGYGLVLVNNTVNSTLEHEYVLSSGDYVVYGNATGNTTPLHVLNNTVNVSGGYTTSLNATGHWVNMSFVCNGSSGNVSGLTPEQINESGLYVYIAGFELNPLTFEILLLLGLLWVAYKFSHRYFLVHPFLFFMAIMILLIDFADLKDIFLSDDSFGLFSALYITAFFVILFVKLRKGFKEWDDTRKNRKH